MQTASFDTAFHATHSALVRRFAIPRQLHDQGIKRYGFHGLSYRYIARQLADLSSGAKVVAAHLGSGASLCAMEGSVILHLLGPLGISLEQVETMLYRESGLLGVSGFSADSRELIASNRPEAAEAIAVQRQLACPAH